MNPLTCLKLIALRICLYNYRWLYRTSTSEQEKDQVVQSWLKLISSSDPEATEPALGVYPWFASDPEMYTEDTFKSQLRVQRRWDYYADPERSRPQPVPERYDLGPKLSSQLDKLDNSRLSERKPEKYTRERCRIVLLPYLEAAVERYEKDRTVAGKYELLRFGSTKVKDMLWYPEMKTRRLIARSNHTITFTNAEGQRRDPLAVVVAKEINGDAYNPLLAYMGIVHTNRRDRGEKNRVVYGIATDGYRFEILMIDNESNLFHTCVYTTDEGWGFFLKYLDCILAEAGLQCEE